MTNGLLFAFKVSISEFLLIIDTLIMGTVEINAVFDLEEKCSVDVVGLGFGLIIAGSCHLTVSEFWTVILILK